jgi:hypothetical protein
LGTLELDPMTGRRLVVAALAALGISVALAGCGGGGKPHEPTAAQVPLVDGASVVAQVRQCDKGANAYCAIEMVVTDPRYRTSTDLVDQEHQKLRSHGWTGGEGDTADQKAADSPGHKLRVTYATASGDLRGVDLGSIQRSRKITLALSRALFDQAPAMSLMLEVGAA